MAHLPQAPGPGPAGQRLVHGQLRDAGRHEAPLSTGRNMSPDALAGLGFVYFGNDWFAENRTSSHHVAARIARIAPLLYVDSPGMRRPDGSRRSEEHTSELQSLMRISYAVFCLKKNTT